MKTLTKTLNLDLQDNFILESETPLTVIDFGCGKNYLDYLEMKEIFDKIKKCYFIDKHFGKDSYHMNPWSIRQLKTYMKVRMGQLYPIDIKPGFGYNHDYLMKKIIVKNLDMLEFKNVFPRIKADVIVLRNVLHFYNKDTIIPFMRTLHSMLTPIGKIFITNYTTLNKEEFYCISKNDASYRGSNRLTYYLYSMEEMIHIYHIGILFEYDTNPRPDRPYIHDQPNKPTEFSLKKINK